MKQKMEGYMTDVTNETATQQAQGEAERRVTTPQPESEGWSLSWAKVDGLFSGSRSFFQGTVKNGIGGFSNYGDSVVDNVDNMRDLITNKPFETVESFVFGLFSWDWGKDFSFTKNYEEQKAKAGTEFSNIGSGLYSSVSEILPTGLLDLFRANSQEITTPEQEAAVNGQDAARVAMMQSQSGNGK